MAPAVSLLGRQKVCDENAALFCLAALVWVTAVEGFRANNAVGTVMGDLVSWCCGSGNIMAESTDRFRDM